MHEEYYTNKKHIFETEMSKLYNTMVYQILPTHSIQVSGWANYLSHTLLYLVGHPLWVYIICFIWKGKIYFPHPQFQLWWGRLYPVV